MDYKLSNKPMIFWIFVALIHIFFLGYQCHDKDSKYLKFTTRIGATSYNISNRWYSKFHYMDGTRQGRFNAKSDSAKLIYSGNIEKGTIVFQLYDREDRLIATMQSRNTIDTLKNIFKKGEKYKIQATATKAKGRFDFKME